MNSHILFVFGNSSLCVILVLTVREELVICQLRNDTSFIAKTISVFTITVSYTHLDVYKRQHIHSCTYITEYIFKYVYVCVNIRLHLHNQTYH